MDAGVCLKLRFIFVYVEKRDAAGYKSLAVNIFVDSLNRCRPVTYTLCLVYLALIVRLIFAT
jgi:hypothetical protein